jgi:hypothetical protein
MFLPWLRLLGPEQVGRIRFVPLRSERKIDPIFAEIEGALTTILSSYRDIDGTPTNRCHTYVLRSQPFKLPDLATI